MMYCRTEFDRRRETDLTDEENTRADRWTLPLLGVLIVAGAALRLHELGGQSLWYDEAASWDQVRGDVFRVIIETATDKYPPLYNLLTWLMVQIFGDAEWVLRLPAALLGIAAIPATYLLGARIAGRFVGLAAAVVIAFSGFHIWYSQEARMYTLLALTSIVYAWALLRYLDEEPRGRIAVIVACTALLFSHPYGIINCAVIAVGALLMRPRPWDRLWLRRLIKLHLIAGAIFLPWAIALLVQAVRITLRGFWIPSPTPEMVLQQLNDLTGYLLLPMAGLAILALVPLRGRPRLSATLLLLSWAVGPALVGIVVSLINKPIFISRYVIGSLPPLALLAAIGAARLLPGVKSQLLVLAAITAGTLSSLVLASSEVRTDWRGAVALVSERLQPRDCFALLPTYNTPSWSYYDRQPQPCWLQKTTEIEERLQTDWTGQFFALVENTEYDVAELDRLMGAKGTLRQQWSLHNINVYQFDVGTAAE